MGKSIKGSITYAITLFFIFSIFITSCSNVPAGSSCTASRSESQSVVSNTTSSLASAAPTPADVPLLEQSEAATTITAKELGMDSLNTFSVYWSPDAKYAIFEGILDRQIENVYLYNTQDKKITAIFNGAVNGGYISEPQWSEDSTWVALSPYTYDSDVKDFPIYIYDVLQGKLDELPVSGLYPAISPDKSKVVFFNKDAGLSIFDLSSRTTTVIPGKIKGYDPLWFSDNTRILFKKDAQDRPSTTPIEGVRTDFYIIDTKKPESIQTLGMESCPGSMTWLIQDEMVWNISQGEGVYFGALDLDLKKYTDFMEYKSSGTIYHIDGNDAQFILFDQEKDNWLRFKLLDRNMVELGKYQTEIIESGDALSVLPDGSLLYLSRKQNVNTIMLSYLNSDNFIALSTVEGFFLVARSKNGAGVALISKFGDKMVLIDTTKIKVP